MASIWILEYTGQSTSKLDEIYFSSLDKLLFYLSGKYTKENFTNAACVFRRGRRQSYAYYNFSDIPYIIKKAPIR